MQLEAELKKKYNFDFTDWDKVEEHTGIREDVASTIKWLREVVDERALKLNAKQKLKFQKIRDKEIAKKVVTDSVPSDENAPLNKRKSILETPVLNVAKYMDHHMDSMDVKSEVRYRVYRMMQTSAVERHEHFLCSPMVMKDIQNIIRESLEHRFEEIDIWEETMNHLGNQKF